MRAPDVPAIAEPLHAVDEADFPAVVRMKSSCAKINFELICGTAGDADPLPAPEIQSHSFQLCTRTFPEQEEADDDGKK